MENKPSTPGCMFTFSDWKAAVGRQYGRVRGSSRNYGEDLEACTSGQMRPGVSGAEAYGSTSCPDSHSPGTRLPHPNISSQAQFYRRSYPDRLAGSENGTVGHAVNGVYSSGKLPGFQQITQQSMQYSIPSPSVATPVSPRRPSNSSSRPRSISSRPSSSGSRASNRENHRRGGQNIGVGYEESISIRLFFF